MAAEFYLIAAIMFLVAMLFVFAINRRKKTLAKFARDLQMINATKDINLPRFAGEIEGHKIILYQKEGFGENVPNETLLKLELQKNAPLTLSLTPEISQDFSSIGFLNKLGNQAKRKLSNKSKIPEIKTRNKAFDNAFFIQGTPSTRAKELLTPDICQKMLELKTTKKPFIAVDTEKLYFELTIEPKQIVFNRKEDRLDAEYYKKAIKLLLQIAKKLEDKKNT
jgi:hypothetical protein